MNAHRNTCKFISYVCRSLKITTLLVEFDLNPFPSNSSIDHNCKIKVLRMFTFWLIDNLGRINQSKICANKKEHKKSARYDYDKFHFKKNRSNALFKTGHITYL